MWITRDRIAGATVAALLATVLAAVLAGCGGGAQSWAATPNGSTSSFTNRVRAQLRSRVQQDVAAGGEAAATAFQPSVGAVDSAVERMEVQPVSLGSGASRSSGSSPPPPSPWDAASPEPAPASNAAARLVTEVQSSAASPTEAQPRYAQNVPPSPSDGGTPPTATDATARQLLIYEANLGIAVLHVVEIQDQVEAMARERGGFLATRTDDTIVVRVPADAFEQFLAAIQELGDVVTRHVQVQDVSEEFHDVQQRIHTLEVMRARVEQLLQDADDVQAALAVQQHLEEITVELEQLQGRLRFLSDRVAYSTITVHFAEATPASEPAFRLPFRWLQTLGLDTLLSL